MTPPNAPDFTLQQHYYAVVTAVLWEKRPYFLALRFSAFVFSAAFSAVIFGFVVYKLKDAKWALVVGYSGFLAGG